MVRIHVGVDLEHEAAESLFLRLDGALFGFDGTRLRGYLYEAVEQFLDTECVERRPEENRSQTTAQIFLFVELGIYPLDELKVFAELGGIGLADFGVDARIVYVADLMAFRNLLLVGLKRSRVCS